MRALVLDTFDGPFVARDVPTPAIGPHEALVRVRNVGVCGTDVKIRGGRMGLGVIPLIMGHEIAGEIAEVGSEVRGFAPGDRVVVNFYVTCGRCQFCRVGRDTLCPEVRQHGFSIDGGFAEYVKTPGVNLCKVPDDGLPLPVMPHELVRNELEIVGSRANTKQELQETMALVGHGRIKPIVDRVIPLDAIEEAFTALREGRPVGRNVLAI
jgi:D-arabinose 1-dehydrogenase-like Zn-dependent alcohol dehydrogenase